MQGLRTRYSASKSASSVRERAVRGVLGRRERVSGVRRGVAAARREALRRSGRRDRHGRGAVDEAVGREGLVAVALHAGLAGAARKDRDGDEVAGAVAADDVPAELGPAALDEAAAPGVLGGAEFAYWCERLAVVWGGVGHAVCAPW